MGNGLSSASCFEDHGHYNCLSAADESKALRETERERGRETEREGATVSSIASPYAPRDTHRDTQRDRDREECARHSHRFREAVQGENPLFRARSMVADKTRSSLSLSQHQQQQQQQQQQRISVETAELTVDSAASSEKTLVGEKEERLAHANTHAHTLAHTHELVSSVPSPASPLPRPCSPVPTSADPGPPPLLDVQLPRRSSTHGQQEELWLQLCERNEDEIFVAIMSADTHKLKALLARYRYFAGAVYSPQRQSAEPVRFAELTWRKSPYSGCSPLHIAVLSSNAAMVELVLAFGADLYSKDEDGNTALAIAYALGHVDMVKAITKHASGQFSSTPCSPCLSSVLSMKSVNSDDSRSLAVSSITSASVTSSAKHRPRGASLSSIDSVIHLRGRSQSFSGVTSRSESIRRLSQRSLAHTGGIAMSPLLVTRKEENRDEAVFAGDFPAADTGTDHNRSEEKIIDIHRRQSFHFPRDSGTFSLPESVLLSSDGGHDGTNSFVSDLTTDSQSKSSRSTTKKLRKAAGKVLNLIRKK